MFQGPDEFYTGLAVQHLDELSKKHPQKRFVEYSGGTFPFKNTEFDWVFSNAVIEHVGDKRAQLYFVNEMLRVGQNVFFTTPNKNFFVETHTNLILLHWLPGEAFYRWCARRRPDITRENLSLMSYNDLVYLMKKSAACDYHIYKNLFLNWAMTFTVVCKGGNSEDLRRT